MISILYSIICFINIYIINQLFGDDFTEVFFYPVLICQTFLTILLLREDKYCIKQSQIKLHQSYKVLNDMYSKKKV